MRRSTQIAFLAMRLLGTPCWCLLGMLVFILYKYLHASSFHIMLIIALKPTSSLLSPYWSQAIYKRPDKILKNLACAHLFRHLPFLFVPWIQSPWYLIASFGLYMMLSRATIPAWMELFKYNLPHTEQEKLVGYGTIVDYLGGALLAVGSGLLLDYYPAAWPEFIALTALLALLSTTFLTLLSSPTPSQPPVMTPPLKEKVKRPWKQVKDLLFERKDFALFQIGFMLGGAGLMIMQPALPGFFIDTLKLSFTEMGLAISLCKGVGVALTSPLWAKIFRKFHIFYFSALVTLFAAIFPLFLLASSLNLALLYVAFTFYGIMQAGSEMCWHMSGLVFAKEADSSTFSVTNVLTVGIRGCIVPALGALLLLFSQSLGVILMGAALCLSASAFFLFHARRHVPSPTPDL